MRLRRRLLATSAGLVVLSASLAAQWIRYPTPGIPRLPDGKPNLSAPAPRTADGEPDVSGLGRAGVNDVPDLARLANFSRDDPSASCIPGGIPRSNLVTSSYPFRLIVASGRVVMLYEAIHAWREVVTDGRALPKDMSPTWMGYSIGRWEGDELVVETAGFNDKG